MMMVAVQHACFCEVSDAEVNRDHKTRVSEAISGGDGVRLARQLGLDDRVINDTKACNVAYDASEVTYQLLLEWHDRRGKDATLKVLADALVSIGRVNVAELLSNDQC